MLLFYVKLEIGNKIMRTEWTKQEERYMERYYLCYPVEKMAKKLNRSVVSVKHKAARMGLNHYTDSLNAKAVARCFNSDVSVVIRWIEKFDLPCRKIKCKTQTRYVIDTEKFWKWAEHNKGIVNWSKYELMSMCPEPRWLEEEIQNYTTTKSRKKFTQQEIVEIKNLLHRGLNYKEIATQMGRSYYSINHLCLKISA